jgi:hypothetical protein
MSETNTENAVDAPTGKDAALSVTNIGATASMLVAVAALLGVPLEATTATALVTFAVTVYGRWRAGGLSSVFGLPLPKR